MTSAVLQPPNRPFRATARVPGDKSLSHRALVFSAMAAGVSRIDGLGTGADIRTTEQLLRQLGIGIEGGTVNSPGVSAWDEPGVTLDCHNSGTTLRIMAGALAARPFRTTLAGDESLMRRPMKRLVDPLTALGSRVELGPGGRPPVTVSAAGGIRGADVEISVASAQVRTAFELAALQADGGSTVTSPPGFRDHTERWLEALGLGTRTGASFKVRPGPVPPHHYDLPGDTSSAAFLWATAAISPGSSITTPDVSLNPGRLGFLQVLNEMGAAVEAEVTDNRLGDPVGWVTVKGGSLRATDVSGDLTVATLDELPLVAVVASFADGITTVRDAAELRAKESDRIATTCRMIRDLGGGAEESGDGFQVIGLGWLEGGATSSEGDHRIALAAAAATAGATGDVIIEGAEAADISWPGFYGELESVWSSQ